MARKINVVGNKILFDAFRPKGDEPIRPIIKEKKVVPVKGSSDEDFWGQFVFQSLAIILLALGMLCFNDDLAREQAYATDMQNKIDRITETEWKDLAAGTLTCTQSGTPNTIYFESVCDKLRLALGPTPKTPDLSSISEMFINSAEWRNFTSLTSEEGRSAAPFKDQFVANLFIGINYTDLWDRRITPRDLELRANRLSDLNISEYNTLHAGGVVLFIFAGITFLGSLIWGIFTTHKLGKSSDFLSGAYPLPYYVFFPLILPLPFVVTSLGRFIAIIETVMVGDPRIKNYERAKNRYREDWQTNQLTFIAQLTSSEREVFQTFHNSYLMMLSQLETLPDTSAVAEDRDAVQKRMTFIETAVSQMVAETRESLNATTLNATRGKYHALISAIDNELADAVGRLRVISSEHSVSREVSDEVTEANAVSLRSRERS